MEKASVSVIIPCFNSEKTILRALCSVKEQTLPVKEIICIDDCSTDNTVKIIKEFITDHPYVPVKLVENTVNRGPSFSRNTGWNLAQENYIAFLDSDDTWHHQKVFFQYSWMLEHPEISLCGHLNVIVDESTTSSNKSTVFDSLGTQKNQRVDYKRSQNEFLSCFRVIVSNPFVTPSVMLKKNINSRFNINQRYCEDHLLWMQLCCSGNRAAILNIELAYVHKQPASLSTNRWKMRQGEIQAYFHVCNSRGILYLLLPILVFFSILKYIRLETLFFLRKIIPVISIF